MMDLQSRTPKTVVSCYELLDLAVTGGIEDYTEGTYEGDINRPYKDAQRAQGNYLLDEIRCRKGSHILDIGCGNELYWNWFEKGGPLALELLFHKRK
jgi:hypothetical protein